MKIAMFSALIIGSILTAGCVTESVGLVVPEAASDDEQSEVNLALGVRYVQEGRADLAIEPLLRAIEVSPRSAEAHSVLALAYDTEGSIGLAEQHHTRAAQLAPGNPDIQNGYAVFLCRQNRWSDAEPYFERAIRSARREAMLNLTMNAALCARRSGEMADAERYFRSALDLDRQNVNALRAMVDISIRTSDFLAGRAFWQRLEAASPIVDQDLYSCYVIETELNASTEAQACLNRLREEFPGSPVLNQLLALERDGI
jgi:type IV pilus assembly protein PilF